MRKRTQSLLGMACAMALVLCLCPARAIALDPEKSDALARLNEVRRSNGIPPLAWNALLARAAQAHSEDMASGGFVDTTGSDGSSPSERIASAGYAAWPRQRVWAESVYAGQGRFDQVLAFLLSNDEQRRIVLSTRLREVGIGIARDKTRTYWTLTFGAQPNLLPVFINDDAPVTNSRQVAVLLTQEEAVPEGDRNAIGRVLEVRLSDRPDFAGADWQPWEPLIPYTLPDRPGQHTVYVEMRDGTGRTTIVADSIAYDPAAPIAARPLALEGSLLPTPEANPQGSAAAATEERPALTASPAPLVIPTLPSTPEDLPVMAVVVTLRPTPALTEAHQAVIATPTPTPAARRLGVPSNDAPLIAIAVSGYLAFQLGLMTYMLLRRR
jgi:hypothetical protein